MQHSVDPYTGEYFLPKRKNQVFASSINRRNYHNDNATKLRRITSPIDNQLKKNFQIISSMVKRGQSRKVEKEELTRMGFHSSFFTHLDMHDGKTCRCIYHFKLPPSENPDLITIIYPNNA